MKVLIQLSSTEIENSPIRSIENKGKRDKMDNRPHGPRCLRYICTCDLKRDFDKLKDLQEETKEKIEELEELVQDRGCEE